MRRLQALEVRKRFGGVLDDVVRKNDAVVIERAGRPLVVMMPFERYQAEHNRAARRERLQQVIEGMNRWSQRNAKVLKGFDPIRAIREIREHR